jgi:hypothetical protein
MGRKTVMSNDTKTETRICTVNLADRIEAAIRKEIREGINPTADHNELDAMIAELQSHALAA